MNQNGTINRNSRAIRSGEVKLCKDGKVDKRYSAFRQGKIVIDSNGLVDLNKMKLDQRINSNEMSTMAIK